MRKPGGQGWSMAVGLRRNGMSGSNGNAGLGDLADGESAENTEHHGESRVARGAAPSHQQPDRRGGHPGDRIAVS